MKALLVIVLCLPIAACQNKPDARDVKIAALEQRIAKLETAEKASSQADTQRRIQLQGCLRDADSWYESNIRLNATSTSKKSFSVPLPAMQQALNVKRDKVEQCKLLYASAYDPWAVVSVK